MKIRHERPMPDLAYMVRAPLTLELATGDAVVIEEWSLKGLTFPGDSDLLPQQGTLCIPFQGIDLRFPVRLTPGVIDRFLEFDGLTGRQRETLALFYRGLLSGQMAGTDEMITCLDTPVDLVPMGETASEQATAVRGKAPRVLRVLWNLCVYALVAAFVFGVLGRHILSVIDSIDVERGRIVAPEVVHRAAISGFVRDIAVSVGDRVQAGDVLMVLGTPDLDAAVTSARHEVDAAARALAEAEAALAALRAVRGTDGSQPASVTERLALAARLQTEFFRDGDMTEMKKLWGTLRNTDRRTADTYSPDTVIEDRLTQLVTRLEDRLAERQDALGGHLAARNTGAVRALTAGTVLRVPVLAGQFVEDGTLALSVETDAPRMAFGWMTAEVAEDVHIGQEVEIAYTEGEVLTRLPGRIASVRSGADPGQPQEFGMVIEVTAVGLDAAATRAVLAADAPVSLTVRRGLVRDLERFVRNWLMPGWRHVRAWVAS